MSIHILTTGGTIEGLDYTDPNEQVQMAGITIEELLSKVNVSFDYSITKVFSKDSRVISENDREALATAVKTSSSEKILITHGTYTMIDTAKYLGALDIGKTIVLTGAFILGTNKNSDALSNLEYAISAFQKLSRGVYIAMNRTVFHYNNVQKNLDKNKFEPLSE